MKIVDYKIAAHYEFGPLVAEVNLEIAEGWQPYYSPYFDPESGNIFQALVKYQEEDIDKLQVLDPIYVNDKGKNTYPRPRPNPTPRR